MANGETNLDVLRRKGLLEDKHEISDEHTEVVNKLSPEELKVVTDVSEKLGLKGGLRETLRSQNY